MRKTTTDRTRSGDMWDGLAYEQMGSSIYADKLMKANPQYLNYYIFPAGIELVIPAVEEETVANVPIWKRGILIE